VGESSSTLASALSISIRLGYLVGRAQALHTQVREPNAIGLQLSKSLDARAGWVKSQWFNHAHGVLLYWTSLVLMSIVAARRGAKLFGSPDAKSESTLSLTVFSIGLVPLDLVSLAAN
jgi:hypothetical protein